jgi:hypothetical protein
MSRTLGAKDKKPRKTPVKKVIITKTEVDLAEKLGVPVEAYAKEKLKLRKARKPRKPRVPKVDWEKLAKNLQQALATEIKENDSLKEELEFTTATLHLAAAKNAVLLKQIQFVQDMTAKVLANRHGND